jgi:hypothetical protein
LQTATKEHLSEPTWLRFSSLDNPENFRFQSPQLLNLSPIILQTVTKGDSDEHPDWLELHGSGQEERDNWKKLLPKKGDPGTLINEDLKKTIIKYGEMAQLTYDSVDLNPWSRYRDQNR